MLKRQSEAFRSSVDRVLAEVEAAGIHMGEIKEIRVRSAWRNSPTGPHKERIVTATARVQAMFQVEVVD